MKLFGFWAFHLPIGLTGLGSGTSEKQKRKKEEKKKRVARSPSEPHGGNTDLSQGLLFIICPVTIVLVIYTWIGLMTWLCGSAFADENEIWLFG